MDTNSAKWKVRKNKELERQYQDVVYNEKKNIITKSKKFEEKRMVIDKVDSI